MTPGEPSSEDPPLPFHSILFNGPESPTDLDEREEPSYFSDLNLGQIFESISAGYEEYKLAPFFYSQLDDVEAVHYRHEVLRDLEGKATFEQVRSFGHKMHTMREHLALADKLHHQYQQESWFLDAVEVYCDSVRALARDLDTSPSWPSKLRR